ncbi:ubiquinol oxidase subunit II [Variovorax sp. PAMC 28711]|uniref:ubiquinol oxidase subunit II n=1 Tax=Variovorax sp. PAMC 28711 TaxID=1795631 RepID=UPI00078C72EB|nr:ubiquinol oxidase subunit II [Variovorax sp. PAMC 28711]AMM26311.1 cytochrome ubiquinol oxidase subunit II [Variovorax sp. PAMC 28711]
MTTPFAFQSGALDPQGPVAAAERLILLNATVIMLAVIVPVILLTLAVAWWFRAGNRRARRRPDWSYSGPLEVTVWSIPLLVILFLGGIAWLSAHDLDPRKPLDTPGKPLDVEVVSLDWKWLFIYPESGVASVNHLVVPAGRALRLKLTSTTVMNSFLVPQLAGQIYTMAGMTTQLHLQADRPGLYPGLSAQFSGDGFSDMRFEVEAVPETAFSQWVEQARNTGEALDQDALNGLKQPGTARRATYRVALPQLFETLVHGTDPSHHP